MDLNSFLTKYKCLKGEDITHTSMGYPTGSYYIPYDNNEQFFKLYYQQFKKGDKLSITEKHKEFGPIVIDLDFRYNKGDLEIRRVYNIEHLKEFLITYLKYLSEYITFDTPEIFVLEKTSPKFDEDRNIIKDGVHIMITNVITIPTLQFKIRDLMLPHIDEIFKDCCFTNSAHDIFDHNVIEKNNWLLYGSSKPNSPPYKVTSVFEYVDDKLKLIEEEQNDFSLIKKLSIRSCNYTQINKIKDGKISEISNIENISIENERKRIAITEATQLANNDSVNFVEDIEIVRKLINILSPTRSESYESWIRIGWCLRNIDNRLLDEWIDFSQQSDKYQIGECEKHWNKMKKGGLTIGSLHMWAKNDNVEEYGKIIKESGQQLLVQSLNTGDDYDIGQYIHHCYMHSFHCTAIKQDIWYHFRDHKWNLCESAVILLNNMSTEIHQIYQSYIKEWKRMKVESGDESKNYEHTEKAYNKVLKGFKSTPTKKKLKETCAWAFHHDQFQEKLDSNPHLLCFKNGVFDLDACIFREGRPEDYVSLCTNIDYIEYDENDPIYDEINHFLYTCQPNKPKREYILRTLANSLHGSNREEKSYFWTGSGGNGKSKLYSLLEACLGDYSTNISVSYITQKRAASNSANPEMVKAIGRRFVAFQEPEEGEKINTGILKELSGRDKIQVRGLYQTCSDFQPQFQTIFICNQLPSLPSNDAAVWRRVVKITFDSKFVDNPNPNDPNEFPIDLDIDQKWPQWKERFISLLLHYYVKYRDVKNVPPEEVVNATLDYQQFNDKYIEFVENHIQPSNNPNAIIRLSEAFEEYKQYCQNWSKNKTDIRADDLRKCIEKVYGKPNTNSRKSLSTIWKGLAFFTPDNEESDNDDS